MITRRDFIKTMSLLSGAVLAPVRWLGRWAGVQPAQVEEPSVEGELYAGFVLLPEGAPMPRFVSCVSAPILCQVGDVHDASVASFRGETLRFDSLNSLTENLSLLVYVPTVLPAKIEFVGASIVRFGQSRSIFKARLDFGSFERKLPLISLWVQPQYPRPYPVWPIYEKVDCTPVPGVMLPTAEGYVFQWILKEILYTLVVENQPRRATAIDIAKSLAER